MKCMIGKLCCDGWRCVDVERGLLCVGEKVCEFIAYVVMIIVLCGDVMLHLQFLTYNNNHS